MKKKQVFKAVVLVGIIAVSIYFLTGVLISKWKYPCYESIVAKNFYELKDDTIEVCVLGSSQVVYGVSGMQMYGDYGISAYNLGTALQPTQASYTWLVECDKRQDLKLVVFDVSMLYEKEDDARFHQAYDNMKLSRNKLRALYEHCTQFEGADPFLSYLFPIIKYHNRWQELDEDDFKLYSKEHPVFRGNYAYAVSKPFSIDEIAYDGGKYNENLSMIQGELEGFERVIAYCEENGIELLLIKTPKGSWNYTKHVQTEEYAKEHNLPFIDFSSKAMIEELGLDCSKDFRDKDHVNLVGASKLSKWLGAYIDENYDLTDFREVEGYDDLGYDRYCERMEDANLQLNDDPIDYFSHMNDERYEVYAQLTSSAAGFATEELADAMLAAGFETNLFTLGKSSYIERISQGESLNALTSEEALEYEWRIGEEQIRIHLYSNLSSGGNTRMRVDFKNVNFSEKGLNILVYDTKNQMIVDKATIYASEEAEAGGLTIVHDNTSYTAR